MKCHGRAVILVMLLTLGLTSPAFVQDNPPAPSGPPAKSSSEEPFGETVTLAAKPIIYLKGNSTWDKAFDNLVDAFKSVYALLDKQGIKRVGPSMTIYTQADDTGFQFQAAVPIAEAPKDLPKGDIAVGQSPTGKALKFIHRGSYDSMDNTYEAITNYLDEKRLDAAETFIEEYETDPVATPEDKFVVTIYVPLK
jgi:effector-binding domain-containing protein